MPDAVLTLNAGSSSLKFALFEAAHPDTPPEALTVLARGQVEGIGVSPHLTALDGQGALVEEQRWPARPDQASDTLGHEAFLDPVFAFCDAHLGGDRLVAVGHRIVHGGDHFSAPARLTGSILDALEGLDVLAPLHQPHNLAAAREAIAVRPEALQVGVFDTAFHQTLSPTVRRFGLPRAYEAKGVRRYGFHGLSYAWLSRQLAVLDPGLASGRVIYAHLGAGASLCATLAGRSVDTTMGFTALDGLVMATRSGALDPGVLLYLMTVDQMSPEAITDLLYKRSGLLGVSGVSGDMRTLLKSPDPHAAEAIDLFVWSVLRGIGSLTMALGGLDGIVFTGGIGENASEIRRRISEGLIWMGLTLGDDTGAGPRRISRHDSRLAAWVIPTDEERMIAAGALSVLSRPI